MNLNDRNFRIAFSFESTEGGNKMKNDPSYVRWIFKIAGFKDKERYERLLPSHKCTDADYDEFYPINPD